MLLSLFLDFSAGDGRWLGGIVWKGAFVLWLPQLLMLWLVVRRIGREPRSRSAEVLMLLAPFIVLGGVLSTVLAIPLILLMYADVQWIPWLLTLLAPTLVGLLLIVGAKKAPREYRPSDGADPPAPNPWLAYWGMGLAGLVLVLFVLRTLTNQPSHSLNPPSETAERRAQRAYEDSVKYADKWPEQQPATQPW